MRAAVAAASDVSISGAAGAFAGAFAAPADFFDFGEDPVGFFALAIGCSYIDRLYAEASRQQSLGLIALQCHSVLTLAGRYRGCQHCWSRTVTMRPDAIVE